MLRSDSDGLYLPKSSDPSLPNKQATTPHPTLKKKQTNLATKSCFVLQILKSSIKKNILLMVQKSQATILGCIKRGVFPPLRPLTSPAAPLSLAEVGVSCLS